MAFKMKGFSAYTKPTDPPKGAEKEKKKGVSTIDFDNTMAKLKKELYSLEDPNSERGIQIRHKLESMGEDFSSGNYDEVD